MSDESATASSGNGKTAAVDASKDVAKSEQAEGAATFSLDELRAKARKLFGVSKHAVAGALALETRETWTVEEAAKRIDAFLKREVAPSDQHVAQGRTA